MERRAVRVSSAIIFAALVLVGLAIAAATLRNRADTVAADASPAITPSRSPAGEQGDLTEQHGNGLPAGPAYAPPAMGWKRFASLNDASAVLGAAILSLPRPQTGLASDATIDHVWAMSQDGGLNVWIIYGSGVVVVDSPGMPSMDDPATARSVYQKMATQDAFSTQGKAAEVDVGTVPAYLLPDGAAVYANGESQGAAGSIELVASGWSVLVAGHVSDKDLVDMAASVVQNAA